MIDYMDGTNNLFGGIACGIGCGVSDVINTWCVGINRTIGICGTIAIDNVVPLRSLIKVREWWMRGGSHSHPQLVRSPVVCCPLP